METWQKRTPFLQSISQYLFLGIVSIVLELKRVDMHLKKKKMNFYKETPKKTLTILYRTKNK